MLDKIYLLYHRLWLANSSGKGGKFCGATYIAFY